MSMYYFRLLLLFSLLNTSLVVSWGQSGNNPFELHRGEVPVADTTTIEEGNILPAEPSGNPFELRRTEGEVIDIVPAQPEIMEENPVIQEKEAQPERPLSTDSGFLLIITLGLLLLATIVFILFRSLYIRSYKALFSDNMLSQLYRERDAGGVGRFVLGYVVFFMSAGLFGFYVTRYYGWLSAENMALQIGQITIGVFVVFLLKHIVLAFLGEVFPIRKEIKKYSFTIMIFSLVLGLILTMASFVLLYGPQEWNKGLIFTVIGLIGLVYLLRSLRGVFIANRHLSSNFFHFLLYICAIEIVPALFFYKLLTGNII